jgi:hypothetical protein
MTQLIPLSIGRARTPSGLSAVVDDEDFDRVATTKWRVFLSQWGRVYAVTARGTLLHRSILDAPKGYDVDHINGDGLDNRRSNIRLGTHSQNLANQMSRLTYAKRPSSSRYKGVSLMEGRPRPWRATISVERKQHFLGYYLTQEEAAKAYDKAAARFFGQFARTNFPVEGA